MASMTTDKNGNRAIEFVSQEGTRKRLKLGKMPKADVESIKSKIEHILSRKRAQREPDDDVANWIAKLTPAFADRLADLGVIPPRKKTDQTTLAAFLDGYFAQRKDVKASTQVAFGRVRRHLVGFFGENRQLTDINAGDADNFRLYLQTEFSWKLRGCDEPQKPPKPGSDADDKERAAYDQAKARYQRRITERGLAENTVRRHIGYARQFFKVATRRKLIPENPFFDLKAGSVANPSRMYFITIDEINRVLAACPNDEYRLIVALARFGGLRTPSETFALEWQHVNWEQSRITVPSPKTAHHAGHETRMIPIFPELRPYLWKAWQKAEPGVQRFVIGQYRDVNKNLGTQFKRIIQRAGLVAWPRLFQNLRSSRETELAEKFPLQVVVAWLGNSIPVASKHYLQVTEDHFSKALIEPPEGGRKGGWNTPAGAGKGGNLGVGEESSPPVETRYFPANDAFCEKSEESEEIEKWAIQDSNL